MTTTLGFKNMIDLPRWRPEAPAIAPAVSGSCIAADGRNDETGCPYIYYLRSTTNLDAFNTITGEWMALPSPALVGTIGPGAAMVFMPSAGPRGLIAAGSSTTKVNVSTALPGSVAINQLANRGDGIGYTLKVSDSVAGGTGKTEYKKIIGNTAGTTPSLYLDSALTFTPTGAATYEIRAGRLLLLTAGVPASNCYKVYDIATNTYLGGTNYPGLPAVVGIDTVMLHLSENYVTNDRKVGEGLVSGGAVTYDAGAKGCIQATAFTTTVVTGSGMPADIQTNEFRNYQVRIVEDTTTPAACNQRRRIASNTSGATAAFTVYSAFTTTPSTAAKFVIENDDDTVVLFSATTTSIASYMVGTDNWSGGPSWTAHGLTMGAGMFVQQPWGLVRDPNLNYRHSQCALFVGGALANMYAWDIAGAAGGSISASLAYGGKSANQVFSQGTSWAYDGVTLEGRYLHCCLNGTGRMGRYDMKARTLTTGTYMPYPQGAVGVGNKLALTTFVDGAVKITGLYQLTQSQPQMFSMLVQS